MSPQPATIPAATTSNTEPSDIIHLACVCDENRGLCGTNLRGELVEDEADSPYCVVCLDLGELVCERCGQ